MHKSFIKYNTSLCTKGFLIHIRVYQPSWGKLDNGFKASKHYAEKLEC